jgi:predicted permease
MPDHAPQPPRLAQALLRAIWPATHAAAVLAELDREFSQHVLPTRGRGRAGVWYWRQVISSVGPGFGMRRRRRLEATARKGEGLEGWLRDVRFSVRRLRSRPLFAVLAVLTLGIAAGGSASIWSIVRATLLDPLPYDEDRVVIFWEDWSWTAAEFLHLRPVFRDFEAVAAFTADDVTLQLEDAPAIAVPAVVASSELFDVLGVRPMMGRAFIAGEDRAGAEKTVVIAHSLWRNELGGEGGILGRRLRMDGVDRTVVGVLPPGFHFPDPSIRIWFPAELDPEEDIGLYVLAGRLRANVGIDVMGAELQRIISSLRERFPERSGEWSKTNNAALTTARAYLVGRVRLSLLVTLGGVALILVIAAANVAALMSGQVRARWGELAMRNALGAGARRLARQLLAEALLLGLGAGLIGAAAASASLGLLKSSLPLGSLAEVITLDRTVFAAALTIGIGASILAALAPLSSVLRSNAGGALTGSRAAGPDAARGRVEAGLVIAEVALAVVLTTGAGLLMRSVAALTRIDSGLDTRGVIAIDVTAGSGDFDNAARTQLFDRLVERLATLPSVQTVAVTNKLPLRGLGWRFGVTVEGKPDLKPTTTYYRLVSRGYFETMGIALTSGRMFDASDGPTGEVRVVINQAAAHALFPDEDPIGRRISAGFDGKLATIIGVVENVAEANLTDGPEPARYTLYEQGFTVEASTLVLKTSGDMSAVLAAARAIIADVDTRVAIKRAETMEHVFTRALGPARQVMTLIGLLGGIALLLGAIGVYGVVSHFVRRRTREWGVRLALGLPPQHMVRYVLGRGMMLVLAGVSLGVLGAWICARVLQALLYRVDATDPRSLAGGAVTLIVTGALAAWLPARRAARTDPMIVLRG